MKKILIIGFTILLGILILTKNTSAIILINWPQIFGKDVNSSIQNIKIKKEIFNEINQTEEKILVIDKIIGDRNVKYWEHMIEDIFVINDSILLHIDIEHGNIIYYRKFWNDVKNITINYSFGNFEGDLFWKRKIVFIDKEDCGFFYTFYKDQKYPLFCWEVRYCNGETHIFDVNETPIGYGITAPSERGFVTQGYGDYKWRYWRENAQIWYNKWYCAVNTIKNPSIDQISYFIKNKTTNTQIFYVIAHSGGTSNSFLANKNSYYTSDQLITDMENRSAMKFVVLCCCEAMNNTGPKSLSYEFRKGNVNGTVTVGYVGMGHCHYWYKSLDWQDHLFRLVDKGYTIKVAFDLACAYYPKLADFVRFVGDKKLKITDDKSHIIKNNINDLFNHYLKEIFIFLHDLKLDIVDLFCRCNQRFYIL